jgi:hypothetical protein
MLSDERAEELLAMIKKLVETGRIDFPAAGGAKKLDAQSEDGRESFLMDINRKGTIRLTKCTFQERYQTIEILLRLDIDGPTHENPVGTVVSCPHLHVYRDGADKWAIPLPAGFSDPSDLVTTFREFLAYCNVRDIPDVQRAL